ncbi:carbon starvation CstA family protein, partial [Desulfovibrio sp.]
MNSLYLLLGGLALLGLGYFVYGAWLEKVWGVDPSRPTPAHQFRDGVDYMPSKAPVVLGHHFSSIAGAGPINGPIQAAVFGWLPC